MVDSAQQYIVTPETVVEMFLANPPVFRDGLIRVLDIHPDLFSQYVPQVLDKQTGLLAKDYFENTILPLAMIKAEASSVPLSYLLMDLDGFHDFNEAYTKIKGDEAIAKFTELMRGCFRTKTRKSRQEETPENNRHRTDRRSQTILDHLVREESLNIEYVEQARVGQGEEFGVLLYGCDELTAETVANRFLDKVRKIEISHPYEEGGKIGITASGGIAQHKIGMESLQLRKGAVRAVDYSKYKGKDRITRLSVVPPAFVPKPKKRT
ncbi:GGDEF domain-containing protein [Candidatus Woesearchaeota archaeon]|nr:GGDEF domain-containing protein [Candidatus Woesearchaeota archaeon]